MPERERAKTRGCSEREDTAVSKGDRCGARVPSFIKHAVHVSFDTHARNGQLFEFELAHASIALRAWCVSGGSPGSGA